MNELEIKMGYQVISFLLQYPDKERAEVLPEINSAINDLQDITVKEKIKSFLKRAECLSYEEWIDHYIEYFDFGKITNLYVTYLKLGEQRERGLELLKLKKFYESNGFHASEKELPDYLPLMLEFCALVPVPISSELLQMYYKNIDEIRIQLQKAESDYVLLLEALQEVMNHAGIAASAEGVDSNELN
ncbi:nitrate reductase molybdenum cofactor assembly chaperone [Virgibacillus oceani]|uniref:Nitrate reductase molybdenum cofactor assembly chaperone NarJ n=1 Tax=Virgibacillus oceani TaxID=1479511 RepID=A0A917HPZ3_9BACI|nr:nitrate reductase molybdenum cofactor assembly chaperone [Virgibacillus oceani]GGG85347.1 putative nitrate reductase molybdenum cofactor assembly chaperone NarJ [Virgibacillus oceani]